MTPELRFILHEIARWCGGFVIKQDGKIESVWIWDHEQDRPKRIG